MPQTVLNHALRRTVNEENVVGRKSIISLLAASLLATPAQAMTSEFRTAEVRPGAFVGARVKLPLDKRTKRKPRAELAIAPAQSRISSRGFVSTDVGEGFGLGLSPGFRPTLTFAGERADRMLRMQSGGDVGSNKKLGVSDAGWVAIGVGVLAVAAGAYVVHLAVEADKHSD